MLHWIQERYGAEIVTLTVDLGQPGEDWDVVVGKARDLGAVERSAPTRARSSPRDYVLPAIKANALYGGGYPLFTALARPLIAKLAVEHARAQPAATRSPTAAPARATTRCGSTARSPTLDPELKVLAPVREWKMGREEEIAYAREHGIPIKGANEAAAPYSIDDNLWGRSSEGRSIEDLDEPPPDDVFQLVTPPEEAPDEPQLVRIGFEAGRPVSIDGERLGLVELIERAAEIGARHGAGIVDHIEDRIVGLKVRDIYEVPAAAIMLPAHRELEKLVSTIHQNNFKRALEDKWAYLCYAGLWHEPLREDLDAYMESANAVRDRRGDGEALQGLGAGSSRAARRTRSTTGRWPRSASRAASSARRRAPGSSSCSRCRAGWPTGFATARTGRVRRMASWIYELIGRFIVRLMWLRFVQPDQDRRRRRSPAHAAARLRDRQAPAARGLTQTLPGALPGRGARVGPDLRGDVRLLGRARRPRGCPRRRRGPRSRGGSGRRRRRPRTG